MITTIQLDQETIKVDLAQPLDISITLSGDENNPIAWYLEQPIIEPVKEGKWIAKVTEGASVNFNNIQFNPHAHGTHTESVGHISEEFYSVNKALKQFFFTAKVISEADKGAISVSIKIFCIFPIIIVEDEWLKDCVKIFMQINPGAKKTIKG